MGPLFSNWPLRVPLWGVACSDTEVSQPLLLLVGVPSLYPFSVNWCGTCSGGKWVHQILRSEDVYRRLQPRPLPEGVGHDVGGDTLSRGRNKDGVVDREGHAPNALHPKNDPQDLNHDLAFEVLATMTDAFKEERCDLWVSGL